MAQLVVGGRRVGALAVAGTRRERGRGLLGRDGVDGALLIRPAGSVHTFGMRFAIDVALCDRELRVLRTLTLPPGRVTRPSLRVRAVVEAEAGSFAAWGLAVGDRLEVGQ